ncbi:MAG: membrane protein insertion efficiency factor YidD [Actinomycetota bacterium]|nr:membrane protein insertion efficiency factor YidD [Actinomycetota bacterium]
MTDRGALPSRLLAAPIVAYRRWLSPALPARCRFAPTCSAYALEALRRHGVMIGMPLALWRVLRCHPFNAGGYDPVPPRRPSRTTARVVVSSATPPGADR